MNWNDFSDEVEMLNNHVLMIAVLPELMPK